EDGVGSRFSDMAELAGFWIHQRQCAGRFVELRPDDYAMIVEDAELNFVELAPAIRMRPVERVGDSPILRQTRVRWRQLRRADFDAIPNAHLSGLADRVEAVFGRADDQIGLTVPVDV